MNRLEWFRDNFPKLWDDELHGCRTCHADTDEHYPDCEYVWAMETEDVRKATLIEVREWLANYSIDSVERKIEGELKSTG